MTTFVESLNPFRANLIPIVDGVCREVIRPLLVGGAPNLDSVIPLSDPDISAGLCVNYVMQGSLPISIKVVRKSEGPSSQLPLVDSSDAIAVFHAHNPSPPPDITFLYGGGLQTPPFDRIEIGGCIYPYFSDSPNALSFRHMDSGSSNLVRIM